MRQLVRFLTGHFASHYSPSRERRELWFANPTPPPGKTPDADQGQEGAETEKAPETGERVEGRIGGMRHSVFSKIGGMEHLESQNLFDAYRSLEVAGYLVMDDQISRDALHTIAMDIGVSLDDRSATSLFSQLVNGTPPENRDELNKKLRALVLEQLRSNPRLTMRCAFELEQRTERYVELQRQIQGVLHIDDKVPELESQFVTIERDQTIDERTRELLKADLERETVEALENRMKDLAKRNAKDLDEIFERYYDEIFNQRKSDAYRSRTSTSNAEDLKLSPDEKLNIRIDAMRGMMWNARKRIREARNFGGGQNSKNAAEFEKPDAVMERLSGENRSLRLVLDAQLQEQAKSVLEKHVTRFDRMVKEADPTMTAEKAEQIMVTRTPRTSPAWSLSRQKQEDLAAENLAGKFLAKHGFEIFAMLTELDQVRLQTMRQLRRDPPTDDSGKALYELPPSPMSVDATGKDFLNAARGYISNWEMREADLDKKDLEAEPDIIELTQEQDATEKWAHEMAKIIREIENELPDGAAWNERLKMVRVIQGIPESDKISFLKNFQEYFGRLRNYLDPAAAIALRSQPKNCVTAKAFPGNIQHDIADALESLRNPRLLAAAAARAKEIDARIDSEFSAVEDAAIVEISVNTRTRLNAVIGTLVPERPNTDTSGDPKHTERGLFTPLNHSVTRYLGITDRLLGRSTQLEQSLDAATKNTDQSARRRLRSIYWVRGEVEQMERSVQMLNAIETSIIETDDIPEGTSAEYDAKSDPAMIKIRPGTSRTGDEVEHERAHAILDILTRRAGLFPDLRGQALRMLKERQKPEKKSVDELLEGLTAVSYKHIRSQGLDPQIEKEELMEELLIRNADYKAGRHLVLDECEQELFALMESDGRPTKEKGQEESTLESDLEHIGRPQDQVLTSKFMTDDAAAAPQEKKVFNMREILGDIDRALRNVNQFIYAYTKPPDFPPDLFEVLKQKHKDGDEEFNKLEDIFRNKAKWTRPDLPPEDDPALQERCQKLNDYADKLETVVVNYDNQKLDTTKQGRSKGVWETILGGMRLASINDVVRLWNDTMEDIKDIYKRRQDAVIKDIGYGLTKPLQDSNLLKQIPGAGKYLTGLHAYHQRRYANTEQEAADKWKDGLKNEDSHTLLHFLHYTRNKDTIRGIISLLCDRGEMDWNDWHVWETLNDISGYHMPVRPCLRSDVLRDTWLRKIISYIWNDKELYYHWRSENDSKTKSGKEHFVPWVDQLSNLRGGMDGELNKQLRLWNEWKNAGEVGTPPEDIKPHLYEKVIHYAISNGKMTMEQKFFYLIRGVADGILSIDRLRTLAGEEGGVLNQFPFIDYFYKKNNTLPEVQALASRLRETDKYDNDTFKPGAKTTLWIQLDLVRNKGVQERLSKGTSRTSSETIDHEDVPLFLPQLDYNAVRGMADIISGTRQKMSPEALKNLYCGYSSKFKIFGRLAELEDKGEERFTPEDANILADAIGAYVDVDNILARRGYNTEARPTLSLSQLASAGPSSDGHTTAEYRRNMNYFVKDLVTELETEIKGTSHWQNYIRDNKKKAEDRNPADGTVRAAAQDFDLLGDYISTDDDVIKGKKSDRKSAEVGRKLFEGTPAFVSALKDILPRNIPVLKRILQKYTKNYKAADYEQGFFDEGGSKGEVTLENVQKAVKARDRARREIMEVNEGGHH